MAKLICAIEADESGAPTAIYEVEHRILKRPLQQTPLLQQLGNVFLPAGYPTTVTDDYIGYQIYDSLQAFSSSIAQLLTSRAVLQGFGVGDANASATSALLLTVLQGMLRSVVTTKWKALSLPIPADASGKDTAGRLATILFAHKFGTALEAECKTYRFAADIFNDLAMVIDCLSPLLLPSAPTLRVCLLCLSGMLRALCGVAGGASKASLSVHFAKSGNVGELNAKDSSQETVISLLGLLVGSLVVSYVTAPSSTWILLIFLLAVHLGTNYKAVRCVSMNTINRQRCCILYAAFYHDSIILSPAQASESERILASGDKLRWVNIPIGYCDVGVRLSALFDVLREETDETGAGIDKKRAIPETLNSLVSIFDKEKYLLWITVTPHRNYPVYWCRPSNRPRILIILKPGADPTSIIKAWVHALLLAVELDQLEKFVPEKPLRDLHAREKLHIIELTLQKTEAGWKDFMVGLEQKGWDVKTAAIETGVKWRVQMQMEDELQDKMDNGKGL